MLDRRRIDELVKEHGATWMGRLARRVPVEDVTFEKGFVSRLRVERIPAHWWKDIADAPELATVKRLEVTGLDSNLFEAIVAEFLARTVARADAVVGWVLRCPHAAAAADGARPVEALDARILVTVDLT